MPVLPDQLAGLGLKQEQHKMEMRSRFKYDGLWNDRIYELGKWDLLELDVAKHQVFTARCWSNFHTSNKNNSKIIRRIICGSPRCSFLGFLDVVYVIVECKISHFNSKNYKPTVFLVSGKFFARELNSAQKKSSPYIHQNTF